VADPDCIFCKILAGELPGEVVQEDEHTVAFLDINPWTRGHAVVIPRNHSKDLYEIPDEDLQRTIVAAKRLALRMKDTLGCDGINLLNSCEAPAWQTIFHLHVHVIPRYVGDPLQLPVRPQRAEPEELAAVAAEIR
jgi:histidine triad (HIT) family protein